MVPAPPGPCCVPGEAMKDGRPPTYARFQPITKKFYIKSNIFHVARRTDQLM